MDGDRVGIEHLGAGDDGVAWLAFREDRHGGAKNVENERSCDGEEGEYSQGSCCRHVKRDLKRRTSAKEF